MTADDVRRAITRIAHEIVERNRGLDGVVLVGLHRGGVWLAEQLIGGEVARIERERVPVGAIDVAALRATTSACARSPGPDAAITRVPLERRRARCVLVDDVLFTGRTVRAALDALADYGRPRAVQLAVLVDRGTASCRSGPTSSARTCPPASTRRWWPPPTACPS